MFKTSLVALGGAAFRAKCGKSEDEENKQWSHFKEAAKSTQRLKHEETIPFPVLTSLGTCTFELFSPVLMPYNYSPADNPLITLEGLRIHPSSKPPDIHHLVCLISD